MQKILLGAFILLAACESEPENIQAKAENMSRALEAEAEAISAEAEKGVDAEVAPLDNEADALLNQIGANEAAEANRAGNAQ
ncbi:MAG TPA: hypothetical protein VHM92_02855 [Allosphingosinicella sp.]|nr:hypothetical protein [Allosphingosinicella sp.]